MWRKPCACMSAADRTWIRGEGRGFGHLLNKVLGSYLLCNLLETLSRKLFPPDIKINCCIPKFHHSDLALRGGGGHI